MPHFVHMHTGKKTKSQTRPPPPPTKKVNKTTYDQYTHPPLHKSNGSALRILKLDVLSFLCVEMCRWRGVWRETDGRGGRDESFYHPQIWTKDQA